MRGLNDVELAFLQLEQIHEFLFIDRTCRNLCTTPDFLPQYEHEIQETKLLIERGKAQGREVWVEKNQHLLERYEEIVSILRSGQTRHLAGKKGREYIGEERKNVN